jgi:hypothetical protein
MSNTTSHISGTNTAFDVSARLLALLRSAKYVVTKTWGLLRCAPGYVLSLLRSDGENINRNRKGCL